MNKVLLVGYAGKAPEIRKTASGNEVMNFSVATSSTFLDKNKQKVTSTEWHSITYWNPSDYLKDNLGKGSLLEIEGTLKYQQYLNKQGVNITSAVIEASRVKLLNKPELAKLPENKIGSQFSEQSESADNSIISDDIPF